MAEAEAGSGSGKKFTASRHSDSDAIVHHPPQGCCPKGGTRPAKMQKGGGNLGEAREAVGADSYKKDEMIHDTFCLVSSIQETTIIKQITTATS